MLETQHSIINNQGHDSHTNKSTEGPECVLKHACLLKYKKIQVSVHSTRTGSALVSALAQLAPVEHILPHSLARVRHAMVPALSLGLPAASNISSSWGWVFIAKQTATLFSFCHLHFRPPNPPARAHACLCVLLETRATTTAIGLKRCCTGRSCCQATEAMA